MISKNSALSHECCTIIKGMALLLMVLGHCFSFPSWHVTPHEFFGSCKHIVLLSRMTGICVPLFAFLTGWTYYHHKDKSLGYSIKKITTFLLNYWIILIPISLFAFNYCGYTYSIQFINELLPARTSSLMPFTWYVWFYILMMTLFPLLGFAEHNIKRPWTYGGTLIFLAGIIICSYYVPCLESLWKTYPFALVGFFCAKLQILEKGLEILSHGIVPSFISGAAILFISLFLYFTASHYLSQDHMSAVALSKILKTFCHAAAPAPLFIIGTILLHDHLRTNCIWAPLRCIGRHSMNIWFIHCIFFSKDTRDFVQPIAFVWDNPIWIFGVTILFSLAVSVLLSPVQQYVNKHILNPVFRKAGM